MFKKAQDLRDPQRKSKIKKAIREGIKDNKLLSQVLKENHAEGKFIKELTNKYINRYASNNTVSSIIRDIELSMRGYAPINGSLHWDSTPQGYYYWHRLNDIYRKLKRTQLSK